MTILFYLLSSSNWAAVKAFAVATAASTPQRRILSTEVSNQKPTGRSSTSPFMASMLRPTIPVLSRHTDSTTASMLSGAIFPTLAVAALPSSPSSTSKEPGHINEAKSADNPEAGSVGPPLPSPLSLGFPKIGSGDMKDSMVFGMIVLRILNIARQWITKYPTVSFLLQSCQSTSPTSYACWATKCPY